MKRLCDRTPVLVLLGLVACARVEKAPTNQVRLDSADAFIGGLGRFDNVAELPDGRLVIPQPMVPAVFIANLDDGTIDSIGREGDGPGEYRIPALAFVVHGGPGILDPRQQRITWWKADGAPDSAITIASLPSWIARLDTMGNIYAEQPSSTGFVMRGQEIDSTSPKDSTWIYRMHPPESGRDTVARLYQVGWAVVSFHDGIARMHRLFESADQWGVLPDGSMWILRGQQNRVDRRSPDGQWVIGAPRPWTPLRTTDADREYLVNSFIKASDSVEYPMADTKGPFQDAVAAPDGEVWARLNTVTGDSLTRYELFPVAGPSTQTVILPPGRKVVTVTAKHVYAVHEDEDGFQVLERFARPVER